MSELPVRSGFVAAVVQGKMVLLPTVLLAIYIGSYATLSSRGAYYWATSGEMRYSFGLAINDLEQWFPDHIDFRIFKGYNGKTKVCGNALGWIYCPLILIDRAYFHPTSDPFKDVKKRL